jgi:hypothetical protein
MFPDKTIIKHNKVAETLVETIKYIGIEKVLSLNIYRANVPLISTVKHESYDQHSVGKYWIMVNTSTQEKMKILKEINERLDLKLVIETFTNEKPLL